MNLPNLSERVLLPPPPRLNRAVWLLLILALIGFADAVYLTIKHYLGDAPLCSIFNGCDTVTTSRFATVGPISVALLGALYYLAVFILLLIYIDRRREKILKWVSSLTELGFFASLWFVYLQAFVLKAFCLYCLISAITSTLLFVISAILVWPRKS